MFTGIITHTGVVVRASDSTLSLKAPRTLIGKLKRGGSIAVDGACLTVVGKTANSFSVDVMPETRRRTILKDLARGNIVNLELPTTPDSFLSGHIVQGHVDGVGIIKTIRPEGNSNLVAIELPKALLKHIATKGSVAVNGVSLTVVSVTSSRFTVGIIPHTSRVTTFSQLKEGQKVNIETDIVAKYVERFITHK